MKKNKKALQKADAAKNEREMSGSLDDMVIGFVRRFSFPSQSARHVAISCAILLSAVTFLFLVPFVGKAYHIDDPLFLWAAKHIQVAPFDPYGFGINWYGQEEPMWDVMKNPPLVSYYLAIVSLFFGWGEVAIHLAMMIPAVGVIIGTYTIARRLCEQPIQAAMACLATPVFIVSSTTVMSDIPMLSLWVWSVGLWIKGLDDDRPAWLAFSALLMALAALTKYYGIALVPLLLVYSLAKKRSAGIWALYFLVPITALAAYQWHTAGLYGSGLLTAAANFPAMSLSEHYTNSIKVLTGLAFVGGCIAVGLFYAPFVWERMYLLGGGFLTLLAIASLSLFDTIGGFPLQDSSGIRFLIIVQFSIFLVAGIGILILALIDVREHRDAASLLILLWIAGTFVFVVSDQLDCKCPLHPAHGSGRGGFSSHAGWIPDASGRLSGGAYRLPGHWCRRPSWLYWQDTPILRRRIQDGLPQWKSGNTSEQLILYGFRDTGVFNITWT